MKLSLKILALIISLSFLSLQACRVEQAEFKKTETKTSPKPSKTPKSNSLDGADVTYIGNVPILYVSGTPAMMGNKIGLNFKRRIHFLNDNYMKRFAKSMDGRDKALAKAKIVEKYIPKRYIEEMKGIAKGADISYDDILIINTFVDTYRAGCANYILFGAMTPDGKIRHGRNLDFPDLGGAQENLVLIAYDQEGKNKFVSMSWPGIIGVLTGMNEKKISLGMAEAYGKTNRLQGMTYWFYYRTLLENYGTLKEAAKYLKKMKPNSGNIIMLASGIEKNALSVEVSSLEKAQVRYPEKGVLLATNDYISKKLRVQKSKWRMQLAQEYAGDRIGKMDTKRVKKLLRKTCQGLLTIMSVVMFPEDLSFEIAFEGKPAAKGPWYKIRWQDCFPK
jgi:predicted choloylglycine hydrolase